MIKKLISISIFFLLGMMAIIWFADNRIEKSTNKFIYRELNEIPYNKVGLLLGTSKYLKSGQPNQYFVNRINATVDLFHAKKIDFVVVSGDNRKKSYNEPAEMKNELLKAGIPENKIYLDYAGFRTYDSVIRINKIFGQRQFTIISQDFHNRRAIYIALHLGLEGIGFDAKDVDYYNGFKTKLREKFARVKMFADFVTNKKPKFLGPAIEIK
jgi:SanA protein